MNLTKLPITPELAAQLDAAGDEPQTFTPPPPEPEPQRLVVEHIYEPGHPTDRILVGHFLARVAEERE